MLPALIEAFARAPDPTAALKPLSDVIERLPSGEFQLRLLEARPHWPIISPPSSATRRHWPNNWAKAGICLDGLIDATASSRPEHWRR